MPRVRKPFVGADRKNVTMRSLDQVADNAIKQRPFKYQFMVRVDERAVAPVTHWLLVQYATQAEIKPALRKQLFDLFKLVEKREITSGYDFEKGKLNKKDLATIRGMGFHNVLEAQEKLKLLSNLNVHLRTKYERFQANIQKRSRQNPLEKIHVVEDARYTMNQNLDKMAQILSSYRAMERR